LPKTSYAFRFFDEKRRSKISYKEFVAGIEKLRINFHKNEIKLIFNYLDMDKDKFLNYAEFLKLNTNANFTSRFPSNARRI
jgi:Ca2+-binding EF-hand superfamily protein